MIVHGGTINYPKLYNKWSNMIQRCTNPNHRSYKKYSKLLPKPLCDEWLIFSNFMKWSLENNWNESSSLEIERNDNKKGYFPWNCSFADRKQQLRNRDITRVGTAFGMTEPIVDLFEKFSTVGYDCFEARLFRGWALEDALTKPKGYTQRPRSESNPLGKKGKISNSDVIEARRLFNSGVPIKEIHSKFSSINYRYLLDILHNKVRTNTNV